MHPADLANEELGTGVAVGGDAMQAAFQTDRRHGQARRRYRIRRRDHKTEPLHLAFMSLVLHRTGMHGVDHGPVGDIDHELLQGTYVASSVLLATGLAANVDTHHQRAV